MNTDELYKEMNQEFMGHGIDGIIIQPPFEWTENEKIIMEASRQLALERLNREALNVLEAMKDE